MKFAVVGLLNTVVGLGIYYALLYFGVYYQIANAFSFIISVLNAYYWNHKFVFKSEDDREHKKTISRIYISYGLTFALGVAMLHIEVERLYISKYIAPFLNLFVTVPINFFLNRYFVFRQK